MPAHSPDLLVYLGSEGALPVLKIEEGVKVCGHTGMHRVCIGPNGLVCPGCGRVCRIPVSAGLAQGDEFLTRGKSRAER
jgi:hypothetical protein